MKKKSYDIPKCLGHKVFVPFEPDDYECDYETMASFDCDDCICVTSKYGDYSGIDPRTGKRFKKIYMVVIKLKKLFKFKETKHEII